MRSALFWDFTQRRLVVSFRRFGMTGGGGEILREVLVKIQVILDVWPRRLSNLPSSSGPAVQDEGTLMFNQNVRNPLDTCVRTSCLTEQKPVLGRVTVSDARLLRICEDHCRIYKRPILDLYFSLRALWYIKTLFNTSDCTILQSM